MKIWSFKKIFIEHPQSIGETYFQHMKCAITMAYKTFIISLILLIHAIFPHLYQDEASERIKKLNKEIQIRKGCRCD